LIQYNHFHFIQILAKNITNRKITQLFQMIIA